MAKKRLSEAQRWALDALATEGAHFVWRNRPVIVNTAGRIGGFHANTAMSFRRHNYVAKDPASGAYVITDAGRAALKEVSA